MSAERANEGKANEPSLAVVVGAVKSKDDDGAASAGFGVSAAGVGPALTALMGASSVLTLKRAA